MNTHEAELFMLYILLKISTLDFNIILIGPVTCRIRTQTKQSEVKNETVSVLLHHMWFGSID